MDENSQKKLLEAISLLLEPLRLAAQSEFYLGRMVSALGWDLDQITGFPMDELAGRLNQFTSSLQRLNDNFIETPPTALMQFLEALDLAGQMFEAVREIHTILDRPDLVKPSQFEAFGRDLIEILTATYLQAAQPVLYQLGVLLTLIRGREEAPLTAPIFDAQGRMVRFPHRRSRFEFERIHDLLADPGAVLRKEYLGPDGLVTVEDAQRTADKLFPRLGMLFATLGANPIYGLKPAYGLDFGEAGNQLAAGMLTILLESDVADINFGATLALSPAERGDLGLVVIPFGNLNFSQTLADWLLTLELTAGVQAFAVGPKGLTLLAEPGTTSVQARLDAIKLPEASASAFLLGSTNGTRLEIKHFRIAGEASLSGGKQDNGLLIEIGSAALVISPGDGDSFLRDLLPSEGVRTNFDLALGWSNRQGFYFRGSANLEAQLSVQASVAGAASIDTVYLAIQTEFNDIRTTIAAAVSFKLGPVTAVVDHIGLEAVFAFPEDGGNLGVLDIDIGFKLPSLIGLLIDAGSITGGGFLQYDPENGRYAGALELEIYDISVKAIGLLDTKIPGGNPAYSFVILITTEFSPVPIGFGFTLNGVGGLAGIQRRMVVEELRKRLLQNSLDHILFPENPIRDAAWIVSDLQQVFPPAADRYVFGPMATIGWGQPALLEGELGILLELPAPARLVLLGQFRLALPRKDKAIIELNLDLIGEIDQDRRRIALDGRLRDSRVASFPIEGEMAMRLVGGDEPNFALSIGGFHPDYRPPADFPKLKRVTIPIGLDDNPRLTITGYLALTSNTLQIGAAGELYAEAGWFNIKGEAGFNALFTFSPFSFETDLFGRVSLRKGETVLAALKLEATLSGPTPYHAFGEVCLEIRWAPDICVGFDEQFGPDEQVGLPRVDPWPLLLAAVQNLESWSSVRPAGLFRGATLAGLPGGSRGILLEPAGGVTLRQTVVPLNRRITKFGEAQPPPGSDRFDLTLAGDNWSLVQDFFAPAQFEQLRDDEKLSRPSFERMDAGITFAQSAVGHGTAVGTQIEYETRIIDSAFESRLDPRRYLPGLELQMASLSRSAAANAPLRQSGRPKFTPLQPVPPLAALDEERFVVASTLDLSQRPEIAFATSKGAAYQALADYLAAHPNEQGRLEVFALDELAEEA